MCRKDIWVPHYPEGGSWKLLSLATASVRTVLEVLVFDDGRPPYWDAAPWLTFVQQVPSRCATQIPSKGESGLCPSDTMSSSSIISVLSSSLPVHGMVLNPSFRLAAMTMDLLKRH